MIVSDNQINIETNFVQRVHDAIRRIPKGETRTYEQLAIELGDIAQRASVRLTCLSNHIAYLIPCHRVIATPRSISGYVWGTELKMRLLEAEGVRIDRNVM
ncbi:unnamed protein product [Caenorhabditis angaria]|uniref:Methylated-DNA--protein-cysteine methyltransferase n=1 Tax=Caenorhabditis angaria TaxID=860376 RepID=A0A9P1IMJ8_9PELO|nr:unnamed protein product [Caenorhabditis angaria]